MYVFRFIEISITGFSRFTLVIKLTTARVDTAQKCSFKVLFALDLRVDLARTTLS